MTSVRFGLKMTHSGPRRADQTRVDENPSSHTTGATQMEELLAFGGGPERRKNEPVGQSGQVSNSVQILLN
jgi:hypothetical protein